MTTPELRRRLARLNEEYRRASAEVAALPPSGNGFATRDEMRKAVAELYLGSIAAMERRLQRRHR